jgi:hypothetical protein
VVSFVSPDVVRLDDLRRPSMPRSGLLTPASCAQSTTRPVPRQSELRSYLRELASSTR